MEKAAFFELVKNPDQVSSKTDPQALLKVLEAYPYFQSAYLLLGMVYHLKGDPRFDQWLHTIALHVNDCEQLYQLLHPQKEKTSTELQELDRLIQQTATRYDPETSIGEGDLDSGDDQGKASSSAENSQKAIVDNFLTNYRAGNFNNKQSRKSSSSPSYPQAVPKSNQGNEPEGKLTEAAAEAAIKEGDLRKAIEIYEKLSLQYPEKFNYFVEKAEALKFQ